MQLVDNSMTHDQDQTVKDLGPLSWVLEELRKSFDSAVKGFKRFVRESDTAQSDLATSDINQLRQSRSHLHQACGVLTLLEFPAAALVVGGMESVLDKLIQKPNLANEDAIKKIETASFAVLEYLEALLAGKEVSSVGLFVQYKDVKALAGFDRAHPADLWTRVPFEWHNLYLPCTQSYEYSPELRATLDVALLKIMRDSDVSAAHELSQISLGLAQTQSNAKAEVFWKICAAFCEAIAQKLVPVDIYAKRAFGGIVMHYSNLKNGDWVFSDKFMHHLLFFCDQAVIQNPQLTPSLNLVKKTWGLATQTHIDYAKSNYGLFDPALLSIAKKRIISAKELWTALSGGDIQKIRGTSEQFKLVSESLLKLYPSSQPLAEALVNASEMVVVTKESPRAELAMEVATAILYLEAVFEGWGSSDEDMETRASKLAQRMENVRNGGHSETVEPWIEELYRRVSDRESMGSVVGELRICLTDIEKSIDQYFRSPTDVTALQFVPGKLSQMRGIFSVLGLDQASSAVLNMRARVEEFEALGFDFEKARSAGRIDKFANNLGALGFLIDMLNYQPALVKKLFVYDAKTGDLNPLMGRESKHVNSSEPELLMTAIVPLPQPSIQSATVSKPLANQESALLAVSDQKNPAVEITAVATVISTAAAVSTTKATPSFTAELSAPRKETAEKKSVLANTKQLSEDELELRSIFIEEAHEVVVTGVGAATAMLQDPKNPKNLELQSTLRRAFHTLKGSARMVGLDEFGEAGWSFEQLVNTKLTDLKPFESDFCKLCIAALQAFDNWANDIVEGLDEHWSAVPFRHAADAMRFDERYDSTGLDQTKIREKLDVIHNSVTESSEKDIPKIDVPEVASSEVVSLEVDIAKLNTEHSIKALPIVTDDESLMLQLQDFELLDVDFKAPEAKLSDVTAVSAVPIKALENVPLIASAMAIDVNAKTTSEVHTHPRTQDASSNDAKAKIFENSIEKRPTEAITPVALIATITPTVSITSSDITSSLVKPGSSALYQADKTVINFKPAPLKATTDEQFKVIGSLKIGIPLYNVYLNEADEWSRCLVTELDEWAMEMHRPMQSSTLNFAHSLAGSSATVGFKHLSSLAKSLEHALEKASKQPQGKKEEILLFASAAEECRRLLHQFAAGFLVEVKPSILIDLAKYKESGLTSEFEEKPPEHILDTAITNDVRSKSMLMHAHDNANDSPLSPKNTSNISEIIPATTPIVSTSVLPEIRAIDATPGFQANQAQPFKVTATSMVDRDDDIEASDALDADLFHIFEEEANDLLPKLGSSVRQWTINPENLGARSDILRILHTLKGSSRLAGAMRLGELSHRMESEIEELGLENLTPSSLESLSLRLDTIHANFDALRDPNLITEDLPEDNGLHNNLHSTSYPSQASTYVSASANMPINVGVAGIRDISRPDSDRGLLDSKSLHTTNTVLPLSLPTSQFDTQLDSKGIKIFVKPPEVNVVKADKKETRHSVRVRARLLDRLVNQAGEVMLTRTRIESELGQLRGSLGDLTGNLDRLRQQLRDVEFQAETQMQSRLEQSKDTQKGFDPLEFDRFTRVQELTRMMAESVNDVATVQRNLQRTVDLTEDDLVAQARQTRDLQRDLLRTRMEEFESISDRLYRVVRQAAKDTEKQVKLDIVGGSIEIDRGVLERMTPSFEHLLRNCVAHGLESAQVRLAAGKEAVGAISIQLLQDGNDVVIEFSDDGAGLNYKRIREQAITQKLIDANASLSDADTINLIFAPGLSTASKVTELAGRGIGLDVVRADIVALGGRIDVSSEPNKGSRFKLVLPLTTAVTQVVMVRCGNLSFGVPSHLVEIVRRAPKLELELAYTNNFWGTAATQIPFFWSGALLQASQRSSEALSKTNAVIVVRSAGQRIAIHVDEIFGNKEVVIKNLGPQLSKLPGLAGMAILVSGAVALIYNPVALAAVYGSSVQQFSPSNADIRTSLGDIAQPYDNAQEQQTPLVLVVDDSITVRRVTQRMLQREGFRVVLAVDGLQAIEKLNLEIPDVVLSDIEMPRMDGFDLVRNIRGDSKLKHLPIVMITSRIAEKHKELALELGVNNYLGKPYSEEGLLTVLRELTQPKLNKEKEITV